MQGRHAVSLRSVDFIGEDHGSSAHLAVMLLPFRSVRVKSRGGGGTPTSSQDAPQVLYMLTGARLDALPSKALCMSEFARQEPQLLRMLLQDILSHCRHCSSHLVLTDGRQTRPEKEGAGELLDANLGRVLKLSASRWLGGTVHALGKVSGGQGYTTASADVCTEMADSGSSVCRGCRRIQLPSCLKASTRSATPPR